MSSIMNPVGPEEPSTYWRRRAAVAVVLLVVLWLAWWLLQTAFGSNDEPSAAEPSASPSYGLSMSPSADPSPSTAASSPAAASESPSPSPSPTKCSDADIAVQVTTDGESTAVGAGMALGMTVTNTGSQACRRDVGPGANEVTITSGSALVWSSDYCSPSKDKDNQVLDPDQQFQTAVTWPGTITEKACPDKQPEAQPGTYRVVARNGTVESDPVTFTVE